VIFWIFYGDDFSMRKILLTLALLAGAAVFGTSQARADLLAINVQGPGGYNQTISTTITPGNTSLVFMAGSGGIPTIPGFSLQINVAVSNSPGTSTIALLDLSYTAASLGASGGVITIQASAQGYTAPASPPPLSMTSQINGNQTSGTTTGQSWVNLSNTIFGKGSITPGLQAQNTTATVGPVNFTTPYSLTSQVNLNLGAGGSASGDLNTSVLAPEPATMTLVLTGLPVLGLGLLRRRMKKQQA
jgi:hypothetical protein